MTATTTATRSEICVVACADIWRDTGERLAFAVGTIPNIGVRLARATFAPDLVLTDGEAFLMSRTPPLGKTAAAGGEIEAWVPFSRIFQILESGRRHAMMGASQIDARGNSNISVIGDWRHQKRQLVGLRGAPGNTVNHRVDYWVAKHSSRVFVERVDVVSGVGNDRGSGLPFHNLGAVVTNLGVFGFDTDGSMRVQSLHPGVTPTEFEEATGFPIDASSAPETRQPDEEELRLIRDVLDPAGMRSREVSD